MDIRRDDKFKILSIEVGIVSDVLAEKIGNNCFHPEFIGDDDEDFMGVTIKDACKDLEVDLNDLRTSIFGIGVMSIDALEAFEQLTIIGDGDCPVCGGECEKILPDGASLLNFDWDSEPEWSHEEYLKCELCETEIH